MGRHKMIESPDKFEALGEKYFKDIIVSGDPPTTCGLALALGFSDRQSLYDYSRDKRFAGLIKKFITRIERVHEQNMFKHGCAGSIFWLKNHKWFDHNSIEVKGNIGLVDKIIAGRKRTGKAAFLGKAK
jgi:hypothetical protein